MSSNLEYLAEIFVNIDGPRKETDTKLRTSAFEGRASSQVRTILW
ncbi:hypothetical protein ART_2444 [Arthrobacter sp. PAMC 25486]|nr:hypothetical protein ART_2444 [Arthrobacter sp. PAMC 25486]